MPGPIGNRPPRPMSPPSTQSTRPAGSHDPNKPAVTKEGTARGLDLTKEHTSMSKVSTGPKATTPLNLGSNNAPDVKPDGKHIGGAVINATHDLTATGGPISLQGSDASVPAGYSTNIDSRLAVPKDQYTGKAGTKAEVKKEAEAFKRTFPTHTGGAGTNNVTLGGAKAGYAYVNERQDGKTNGSHAASEEGRKFALQGKAEAAVTTASAQIENSHETRAGKTSYKASIEGPGASVGAEGELRANMKKGEEAVAMHGKIEGSVHAVKTSGQIEHTSPREHFSIAAHGFGQAGVSGALEGTAVMDRKAGTYRVGATAVGIAAAQAGGGIAMRAGPFSVDVTAAKLAGVGGVFITGAGIQDKVATGMLDIGGAAGTGGRVRVGASVDGARIENSAQNMRNKLTNPNYDQGIRDRSRMPSPQMRDAYNKQVVSENLFAEKMNTPEMAAAQKRMQAKTAQENKLAADLMASSPQAQQAFAQLSPEGKKAYAQMHAQKSSGAPRPTLAQAPNLPTIQEAPPKKTSGPPKMPSIAEE